MSERSARPASSLSPHHANCMAEPLAQRLLHVPVATKVLRGEGRCLAPFGTLMTCSAGMPAHVQFARALPSALWFPLPRGDLPESGPEFRLCLIEGHVPIRKVGKVVTRKVSQVAGRMWRAVLAQANTENEPRRFRAPAPIARSTLGIFSGMDPTILTPSAVRYGPGHGHRQSPIFLPHRIEGCAVWLGNEGAHSRRSASGSATECAISP